MCIRDRYQRRVRGLCTLLCQPTMGFFDADLAYPTVRVERLKHKRARLVQGPNSFFVDCKCPQCFAVTTVYSHATTEVKCAGCDEKLTRQTGGKVRFVEGASVRRKKD
eukprot:TRINITY_DN789_c0_g1_i19.p1 TRINITY_DN789_c0_g1~~TRINITY_DN789_c0_g1_i19.p1  ORF type:complete len:108 (+),score=37.66 TRINITY_DN789_c0_g1_i19:89-412(+)